MESVNPRNASSRRRRSAGVGWRLLPSSVSQAAPKPPEELAPPPLLPLPPLENKPPPNCLLAVDLACRPSLCESKFDVVNDDATDEELWADEVDDEDEDEFLSPLTLGSTSDNIFPTIAWRTASKLDNEALDATAFGDVSALLGELRRRV